MTALAVCLSVMATSALAGMGWMAWLLTGSTKSSQIQMETLSRDFATVIAQMKSGSDLLATTLVLGYKDSAPPSEPSSTEPPPSETSKPDVDSWADMPDHIREHYEREMTEDALMPTGFSTS